MSIPAYLCAIALAAGTQPTAAPGSYKAALHCQIPELDFQEPAHTKAKHIAFTFDDGPDGERGETDALLDQLKRLHTRATFFICGDNWVNISSDGAAQKTIRRIVADGHELGNHSSHHNHLPALTPAQVRDEYASTQAAVFSSAVLGHAEVPLTLLRAPFGQPYEADAVNKVWVAPILAQFGVHIGWNINSYDWACKDKMCVVDNVMRAIDAGQEGAILMHSNYRWTTEAMPILVERLKKRGYVIVTVEQLLIDKFGASSEILHKRYMQDCLK
jgi:peptidoglycan/xylan/chitin deacetylase (PgdA/CDA1 family)